MAKLLLVVWLAAVGSLVGFAYRGTADEARIRALNAACATAQAHEAADRWMEAMGAWGGAIALCPADHADLEYQLRSEHARAGMKGGQLPAMRTELLERIESAPARGVSPSVVDELRALYAKASFDLAWDLRCNGAEDDLWQEAAGAACNHLRLLVQHALLSGSDRITLHQKNLERAIRLKRIDTSQLAGMPFPKDCYSTSNCEKKARRERETMNRRSSNPQDERHLEEESLEQRVTEGRGW